jgi:hypothetical protein
MITITLIQDPHTILVEHHRAYVSLCSKKYNQEADNFLGPTSVTLHGATSLKAVIFILATVRNWNVTNIIKFRITFN